MATNNFGFIPKKYRQPVNYRLIFANWNAIYYAENGKVFMIEAQVYRLASERIGMKIESFDILRQDTDCRRPLHTGIKTFKEVMAIMERILEKNSLPKQKEKPTVEVKDFVKDVFVDSERVEAIRGALLKAYHDNDHTAIVNAAQEAQRYVDEGGDFPGDYDEDLEDYDGSDWIMLTNKYILRLLHDRYCDTDDDQCYIATGLPKSMRMTASEEIQIIELHEQFKELDRQQSQRKRIISATQLSLNF